MRDVGDRDSVLRRLNFIHAHDQPGLRVFDIPVGVDNARGALENRLDLLGDSRLTSQVGAVNLRHQRLYDWGSWWNLTDLDASAVLVADRIQQRTNALRDCMALHVAR